MDPIYTILFVVVLLAVCARFSAPSGAEPHRKHKTHRNKPVIKPMRVGPRAARLLTKRAQWALKRRGVNNAYILGVEEVSIDTLRVEWQTRAGVYNSRVMRVGFTEESATPDNKMLYRPELKLHHSKAELKAAAKDQSEVQHTTQ